MVRSIRLRPSKTPFLEDYRYSTNTAGDRNFSNWEQFLVSVRRLLLGQLRLSYDVPKIWNICGNEQVFPLPRTRWFHSLAVSSPTLLLMEGCLSGRSAETRVMLHIPELFGRSKSHEVNDIELDPPLLRNFDELRSTIKQAQRVLEDNQLSVLMNQPRQLIPFRLSDFATGLDDNDARVDITE